ncbi:hypothetical protein BU26DRAFT_516008 [Trematosphaeria pertusa]|uniref:EthD domain-containing protein n=1 Tax=Trematosphaeria pertusa TaxID=390896 RepID=A0A6A6IU93_9PLEO|nr:uncharacterized protein BU26DRAFT_516008 [Trematosphaeria pertusa]KAF2253687.1 hypothetical protein BU26DRAFT_516008 [Trematosphaeria pertusa]
MPFTFLLFITRKPTLTPTEFKTHWDAAHVALLQSTAGPYFPLTHTRRYIARPAAEATTGSWPASVLVGTQEDFAYDWIAELVFEDEAAFQEFMGAVSEPEAARRIAEDEERFIVREKMRAVVLGETSVTSRE